MTNNLEKIVDILSKAITIQQISTNQQANNTLDLSTTNVSQDSSDGTKYIYVRLEDLIALFPGLKDKLDINKILSSLSDKTALSKILSNLGSLSIKPVENKVQSLDEAKKESS